MKAETLLILATLLTVVPVTVRAVDSVVPDDASGDVLMPGDDLDDTGAVGDVETGGDLPAVGQDPGPQRIDILIAYTPAARAYAGSTNAMKAAINGYVEATNDCYENSDIEVVLKLVGAVEVSYTESGSFNTDLTRLQSSSDNYLTAVPGLRNSHQADFVSLIRRNSAGGVAGLAYIGNGSSNFAPYASSVVADVWALGNLAFPHELGHNFGCQHNRENANTTPVRSYAYGHKFTGSNNALYCSVMAYQPGTRVAYFSNPSITYMGAATGVDGGSTPADNARMIEEMAVPTASFRNGAGRLASAIVGDIDNDGAPDLLTSDAVTGERIAWLMDGTVRTSSLEIAVIDKAWRLAASADFNGDAHTDLVWENSSTGARSIWLMDGAIRSSSASLGTVSTQWRIEAAGDFNADNQPDLVWSNTSTGARTIWFMDGVTRSSTASLGTVSTPWRIETVGDFNADNKSDLVWSNTSTGSRTIWLMDGLVRSSTSSIGTVTTAWRIAGAGDFDGDGKTDLAWENASTRARTLWLMDGTSRVSTVPISSSE